MAEGHSTNEVPWAGGLLARNSVMPEEVYDDIYELLETLSNTELMARCRRIITQNVNESIHSKLWT